MAICLLHVLRVLCGRAEYIMIPAMQDLPEAQVSPPVNIGYEMQAERYIELKQVVTNFLPKNYLRYTKRSKASWRYDGRSRTSTFLERCFCDVVEVLILLVCPYRMHYFYVSAYEGRDPRGNKVAKRMFMAVATMAISPRSNMFFAGDLSPLYVGVVEVGIDQNPDAEGKYRLWHMRYAHKTECLIARAADSVDVTKGECIFLEDLLENPRFRCYVDTQGNIVYTFYDHGINSEPTRVLTIYHKRNVSERGMLSVIEKKMRKLINRTNAWDNVRIPPFSDQWESPACDTCTENLSTDALGGIDEQPSEDHNVRRGTEDACETEWKKESTSKYNDWLKQCYLEHEESKFLTWVEQNQRIECRAGENYWEKRADHARSLRSTYNKMRRYEYYDWLKAGGRSGKKGWSAWRDYNFEMWRVECRDGIRERWLKWKDGDRTYE